jgi:HD-GYP domain-containing protein (c-di-GMP phosphodiesterase class II)
VAGLATAVGQMLGLSDMALEDLGYAAELHDVGKMAIPDATIQKEEPLSDTEWDLILRHTVIGEAILAVAPALRPAARLVRASHERWDGRGYPDGLAVEKIPLGSRVIFVCAAYDAMTSDRAHRPRLGHLDAVEELRRHAGSQFDPGVVNALVEVFHRAPAPFPDREGVAACLGAAGR